MIFEQAIEIAKAALVWLLNIVALFLLWLLAWGDIYQETYGWWIGAKTSGPAHTPLILLLLAIPLLAIGVLVANIRAIVSPNTKQYTKVLCGLSSTVLLLGLVAFVWLPRDTLNSLTVTVLGPGKRADQLLYNSAARGRVKTVKTLLDAGVPWGRGESLTHVGAGFGQLEIIKMGLARGDDINAVRGKSQTPLRSAIANQKISAIEFPLANGALATDADKDSIAALLASQPHRQCIIRIGASCYSFGASY